MAQTRAERPSFSFSKGLNTDAPVVVFPQDFTTDESNFELMLDGTRRKRRGLESESPNSELPFPVTEGFVVRTFKWRSVNTNPDLNFHVWQIGYTLVFADDVPDPTNNLRSFTVDLRSYAVPDHNTDNEIGQNHVDMAFGRGHALVTGKYVQPTLLVYNEVDDDITPTSIEIRERDFQGVEDGIDNQTRPVILTDAYAYNLVNQGWAYGDVIKFFEDQGSYPSKNMIPWLGFRRQEVPGFNPDDGTKQFSSDKLINELFQDAPAPRGHFIQNPFDTTAQVTVQTETIKNYRRPSGLGEGGVDDNVPANGMTPWKPDPAYGFNLPPHPGGTGITNLITINFQNAHFLNVGNQFELYTETNGRIGSFTGDGNRFWNLGPNGMSFTVQNVVSTTAVQFFHTLVDDGPGYRPGWIGASWPMVYSFVGGTVLNLEGRIIDERPTCTAFFAGRAWYAGVPNSVLGSALYFSQVVEVDSQYGKCYQVADPTDENISDLIATDGGVLRIPEMGRVYRLLPYADFLLVFASNGVWQIGPGQSGYFTATSYSVRKLTDVGCESGLSVVLAENVPVYWGRSGIFAIIQDTNTGYLAVQSLTRDKIDNFYKAIDEADRRQSSGDFDEINKRVVWIYHETNDDDDEEYKALLLDLKFGAFTAWDFSVQVHDIFTTTDTLPNDASTLRFIVTTDFGATEVGKTTSLTFRDFGADPYAAYMVTGYDTAQNPTRYKYAPVITSFMKRPGVPTPEPSFFLTSEVYPLESVDALNSFGFLEDSFSPNTREAIDSTGSILSGTFREALLVYDDYPAEALDSTATILSGLFFFDPEELVEYTSPAEAIDSTGTVTGGTLETKLISYVNYPPEAIDSTGTILSGTLS